jgi:flagellar hook protein FlgE
MGFQQGVSGLNASAKNLSVIGNNVANASTVGAKASRAEFADVYARSSGADGTNIGLGTQVATVAQQFRQGNVSMTDNPLDVAINGNGFFQMQDSNGTTLYSRNGQFQVDRSGYVVNASGEKLLGRAVNAEGSLLAGPATPVQVPTAGIAPSQTTEVSLEINLDARDEATYSETADVSIDFTDDKTYNDATSQTLYDSKGQAVSVTYYFQKTDSNVWNMYATIDGSPVEVDGDNPVPQAVLRFPDDGTSPTIYNLDGSETTLPLKITFPAPTDEAVSDAWNEITDVEFDLGNMTQFGSVFGPTDVSQDGFPPGRLTSVSIGSDGTFMASYSSGQSSPIARVELAIFRNSQGLQPLGGNVWAGTYDSGDAILGVPGGGNLGLLESKSVEESNVDLTNELVSMMVAQRIYQANAQTIKTEDSVMQTLVSLR